MKKFLVTFLERKKLKKVKEEQKVNSKPTKEQVREFEIMIRYISRLH